MARKAWLRALLAMALIPLSLLGVQGPAGAQSGQTNLDGDGTFGSTSGAMSEQLVAGPHADPPNVNGFWADRNFNWNDTTVAVRMPSVAVANRPVRVWVCLSLGVGDHQGGAGIGYSNLRLLQGGS